MGTRDGPLVHVFHIYQTTRTLQDPALEQRGQREGNRSVGLTKCDPPGSSFGRKKVPDLNPAKFSAGFRKKRRRPEKTSGSKILKNRDDKRLDHTQGNCLCAASSFSGAHSNLPVPIALAHLPNGLRAEPSQNISNLCPSKGFQEETKEHVAMNSSFSATVSLKCFFTKCMGCSP